MSLCIICVAVWESGYQAQSVLESLLHRMIGSGPDSIDRAERLPGDRFEQYFAKPRDPRKAALDELGLAVGQTFRYLYDDFQDEWRFKVRVHDIREDALADEEYPRLVEFSWQGTIQPSRLG